MPTFVHIEGLQGVNLDLVTDWQYTEKSTVLAKRGAQDSEEKRVGALPAALPTGPMMRLSFGAGHVLELTGEAANAVHRHFCTHGRSLT